MLQKLMKKNSMERCTLFLIIFVKNHFSDDVLDKVGSGQIIISLIKDELDSEVMKERGVRDYLQSGWMDSAAFYPGIILGLMKSEIKHLDDDKLIKLSNRIFELKEKDEILPNVFSELFLKIPGLISELS